MNSHFILIELLQVTKLVEKRVWNEQNVSLVCEEAITLVDKDQVLLNRNYFDGLKIVLNQCLKKEPESKNRMKAVLPAVLDDLQINYLRDLKTGLSQAIQANHFQKVHWYTNALATEAANLGFSREYLYNLCKQIFLKNDSESFSDKYRQFIENIIPRSKQYQTYLKLYPNKPQVVPDRIADYTFSKSLQNIETEDYLTRDYLSSGDPKVFAITKIQALDPNSAATMARSKIGKVLDLMYYGYQHNTKVDVHENCLIQLENSFNLYPSIPELVGYFKDGSDWLLTVEKQLETILERPRADDLSTEKLLGALRYFRLSKEAVNIEHQFLNLWIALEHLAQSDTKMFEALNNYIPKTLALQYIGKLIRDMIENLKRCKVRVPEAVQPYISKNNKEKFILLARNDDLFSKLLLSADSNPLLQQRLVHLRSVLSNSKEMRRAINKNYTDIRLHLFRMYRVRNLIVHTAAHDLQIEGLTANLQAYLTDIINKALYELSSYDYLTGLYDVFSKYQFTFDQVMLKLKKDGDKNLIDVAHIINPFNLLWPEKEVI